MNQYDGRNGNGYQPLPPQKEKEKSLSVMFAQLHQERLEAKIRLYGILWLLVEEEVISEGKARELAKFPLHKMIDECLKYRSELEVG